MDFKNDSNIRFTLIEMLVVISIIAILAALLMPSLQNAMESAKEVQELNSFKNVGICAGLYHEDWNGCVVPFKTSITGQPASAFWDKLLPYDGRGISAFDYKNDIHCYRWEDYTNGTAAFPIYWHIARRHAVVGGWALHQFYGGAMYDWSWNTKYGGAYWIRVFAGDVWPTLTRVKHPTTQVLARCPIESNHISMRRGNLFFDGHASRLFQPTDLSLNE